MTAEDGKDGKDGRSEQVDDDQVGVRLARLVAIVLFIKAAGFAVVVASAVFRPGSTRGAAVAAVLAVAMVVVGIGLLRTRRWAWPTAFTILMADAILVAGILRLLIDVGLAVVLFLPRVRAHFGLGRPFST